MSKFKVGDKVEVIKSHYGVIQGEIYKIVGQCKDTNLWRDDERMEIEFGSALFEWCERAGCFKLYKEDKEQMKQIKPEDEVTITTTYGELARAYAVLGNVNGADYGESLYNIAAEAFGDSYDQTGNSKFWEFGLGKMSKKKKDITDYNAYQKEWEKLIFNQKSEKDLKIEELEKTIAEAQKQLQELKEMK